MGIVLALLVASLGGIAAAQERVKLQIWHHWTGARTELVQQQLDEFMEMYPWIEVEQLPAPTAGRLERLTNFIISGASPEIVQVASEYATQFMATGGFYPLDEFIARDNVDLAMFHDGDLRGFQLFGSTYGLPVMSGAAWSNLMFYNKDMLDEVGLPRTGPKTWAEWEQAALLMTKKDPSGTLIRAGSTIPPIHVTTQWNGDALWSDDWRKATVGSGRTYETIGFLSKLAGDIYGGNTQYYAFLNAGNTFYNQDWGLWFQNNSAFAFLKDLDFEWGVSLAPVNDAHPDTKPVGLVTSTWGYAIPASISPEKLEAAWLLLKYLATTEEAAGWFARIQGRPSPVTEFNHHPDYVWENPEWGTVIEAITYDIAAPPVDLWNKMDPINTKILDGTISPTQGVQEMQMTLQNGLDIYWELVEQ